MYNKWVGYEWDEESKAGLNFRKHGVRMPEAIPVFDDPYAITITDEESDPDEHDSSPSAWVRRAVCSLWPTHGVGRIFESCPHGLPKPMNVRNMR